MTPQYLHQVAGQTGQVIFEYNATTGTMGYLNPAFERVWQRTRAEVIRDPAGLAETVHPEDRNFVCDNIRTLLGGKPVNDFQFRILRPDGSERWICLTPFVLAQPSGELIISGFAKDISGHKEYSDVLKKHTAKKNAVLEILSHDLAGPLATIQGLSGVLTRHARSYENPELNEVIELIRNTSQRGISLIREFVNQEFMESASVKLVKKRIDLIRKVAEVIRQYQSAEDGIAKTFTLSAPETLFADIDEVKFMQVINNLISNAIKFTHDNGVIEVCIEEKTDSLMVTVADNGIGIPEKLHAGLFDKFTPARRPGIKGEPSVGLGMSVIKMIVEWHGGRIWFQSRENQGTTFFIEVPKRDTGEQRSADE